jgi:GDP/UDP-N,N'-diacetylbacillosamine 2-epimerase (hydrolysing)
MAKSICIFTGSRAEYGLLRPLMALISQDPDLQLKTLVSGMHLSPEYGSTYQKILEDGFVIDDQVEMLVSSDSAVGVCKSTGLGLIGLGEAFSRLKPDWVVVLGDRYETFAAATAAMMLKIPLAHIHGGEVTEGAIDEAFRHSMTKMSQLHFVSTENYRRRVIQLGENPETVFNVGAIGIDGIKNIDLQSKGEIEDYLGLSLSPQSVLVTFHPETLAISSTSEQFENLLNALNKFSSLKVVFTKANADKDGRLINKMIEHYVCEHGQTAKAFSSLGQARYLSVMSHVDAVVGNSSSGIIEAPSLGIPTVNIGDRQKGRIRAESVIHCAAETEAISRALEKALSNSFKKLAATVDNPYEGTNTALRIKEIIKQASTGSTRKSFFDLPVDCWEPKHAKRQKTHRQPDGHHT